MARLWLDQVCRRFGRDARASVVVLVAVALPALCMAVAGAIELGEVSSTSSMLQRTVDAAALKGAGELAVDRSAATVERSRVFADTQIEPKRQRWSITTTAQADLRAGSITVGQAATRRSFFGNLLPPGGFHLNASATATNLTSKVPLCVLAMQAKSSQVLNLRGSSVLTASTCLVQSNSDVLAADSSRIQAGLVRSVGASSGAISPAPVTDTPNLPDPFASLAIITPGGCNDTDLKVDGTMTLNPGVHCGNINVLGNGRLVLNPGDHYFVDADIDVVGTGQIVGIDVVLVFRGKFDVSFKGKAFLSLEGRRSGPYAGFVLVTDRSYTNTVRISTESARQLLGTIYLPSAWLEVSGNASKVADQSPWTVVVARGLRMEGSAELVINSNYFASAVPVPTGVGNFGPTRLVR